MMRALVVDHEQDFAAIVCNDLELEGFDVHLSRTGEDALVAAILVDPDVVVLDLGLPGIDGIEVCRRLRLFTDCYVVMVTAGGGELDLLIGLAAGADDFMEKPLSTRELVARIHAIARRPRTADRAGLLGGGRLRVGRMTVEPAAREVWIDRTLVALTCTEFDLLMTLAEHPLLTFTRGALVEAVWGEKKVCDEHVVDVHVGHVRRKLGDTVGSQRFIRTVRGVGYRIGKGL